MYITPQIRKVKRMILGIGKWDIDTLRTIQEIRLYESINSPKGMIRITHSKGDVYLSQKLLDLNKGHREFQKLCNSYAVDWKDDVRMMPEDTKYVEVDLKSTPAKSERELQKRMSRLKHLMQTGELYKMDADDILRELDYATR